MDVDDTKRRWLLRLCCLYTGLTVSAENIDPNEVGARFAWGENIGWVNFDPNGPAAGAQVQPDAVTGSVWAENVGWIDLSPAVYGGVTNDGAGNLSGFAWGENIGWVNFDPNVPGDGANQYKVSIGADGRFSGWAWGENVGWIRFDETQSWVVRACVVTLQDLTHFASYWLTAAPAANLDAAGTVTMTDFAIFAAYWQNYCPDGWQLK